MNTNENDSDDNFINESLTENEFIIYEHNILYSARKKICIQKYINMFCFQIIKYKEIKIS